VDAAGLLQKSVFARHIARVEIPKLGVGPVDRLSSSLDRKINDGITRRLMRGADERFDFTAWLVDNPSVRNSLLGGMTQVDAAVGLAEHDFTKPIRDVEAPTTLIWGRDDPIAPFRTGELLSARMQDARLHAFDGVGHVPMSESTDRFNTLLVASLTQPLPPKFAASTAESNHGNLQCSKKNGQRYTGRIASLVLSDCADVIIEFARIGQLSMESSSAIIRFSTIESSGTAIKAKRSRLEITAATIRGSVGIEAEGTDVDAAGVTLKASASAAVLKADSRIYFSVSDVATPEHEADAHAIWTEVTLPAWAR
jgi:hypothetical protein